MGSGKRRLAKLFSIPVIALAGFLVAASIAGVGGATGTTVVAFQGCTPGYWKSPQHADSWVGLSPGQTLESVFNVPDGLGIDDKTLDQALGPPGDGALNGGGPNGSYQLLRHAIAGILNANSPGVNYPFDAGPIIVAVNAALLTQNATLIGIVKDALAAANERRCPLN